MGSHADYRAICLLEDLDDVPGKLIVFVPVSTSDVAKILLEILDEQRGS